MKYGTTAHRQMVEVTLPVSALLDVDEVEVLLRDWADRVSTIDFRWCGRLPTRPSFPYLVCRADDSRSRVSVRVLNPLETGEFRVQIVLCGVQDSASVH